MHKKSLTSKLMDAISYQYQKLKEKNVAPTTIGILEQIQSTIEFSRTPKDVIMQNIRKFIQSIPQQNIESDEFSNGNNINKSNKQSQNVQNNSNNLQQRYDEVGIEQNPNTMNKQLPFMKKAEQKKRQQEFDIEKIQKKQNNNSFNYSGIQNLINGQNSSLLTDLDKIVSLEDLGGMQDILNNIKLNLYLPLDNLNLFYELNISPPKGILLTGPTGSGKTSIGLAICKDLSLKYKYPCFIKSSTEIVGGISGESERNLRQLFQEACQAAPSIIFIDEIDAIAGSRDKASKEMEKRIVSELVSCLDKLPDNVFIIAATSRPESLETAIRRAGRFDNEILLAVPDEKARIDILLHLIKNVPLHQSVNIQSLAKRTPGYVPADLTALVRKAGVFAVQRMACFASQPNKQNKEIEQSNCDLQEQKLNQLDIPEQQQHAHEEGNHLQDEQNTQNIQLKNQEKANIMMCDFDLALQNIQPTGQREGFALIPSITWEDIGGLDELKEELTNNIILPILSPEKFENFNITSQAGVLLYGPPGCGKTLLAKAVSNASKANFISVKGPELLNKYVGESERSVRQVFSRARASAPCIIFFDEIDALCPKRGSDGNQVTERVVNALLAEMDGVDHRRSVYVIAATNRPDIIDPAMLRAGRLEKLLYVPLPKEAEKLSILNALTRKTPLDEKVDLKTIAYSEEVKYFSGADMQAMVKEAALSAILQKRKYITQLDFQESLNKTKPSVSGSDRKLYEMLQQNLRQTKSYFHKKEI